MSMSDRPWLLCHSLLSAGSVALQLALVLSMRSAHQRALSVTQRSLLARTFKPLQIYCRSLEFLLSGSGTSLRTATSTGSDLFYYLFLSFCAELLLIQQQSSYAALKNNYAWRCSCNFKGAGNLNNHTSRWVTLSLWCWMRKEVKKRSSSSKYGLCHSSKTWPQLVGAHGSCLGMN